MKAVIQACNSTAGVRWGLRLSESDGRASLGKVVSEGRRFVEVSETKPRVVLLKVYFALAVHLPLGCCILKNELE